MVDVRPDNPLTVNWAVDGQSKKGVPQATFEWVELFQANGLAKQAPSHLWLMQDTSGPLTDSIGSITLAPQNTPLYGNAIAGWSRVAVGTFDSPTDQGFITGSIGKLNGPGYLLLVYVAVVTPPSAERSLFGIGGGSDHRYVAITPTPRFKGTGAGMAGIVGMANPMATVHPIVLAINPSQQKYVVYTDEEKLTVPWIGTSGVDGLLTFGNAGFGSPAARYLYAALWEAPNSDFADLDVKRMLVGLGWAVNGY
jgi:hypothetical protein